MIHIEDEKIKGVKTHSGERYADAVIICTGGSSYTRTGSDGDGYAFAEKLGIKMLYGLRRNIVFYR